MISSLNSVHSGSRTGEAKCLLCGTQWICIYQHFSEVNSTWGLWWEKWYWDRIFSDYFRFALSISFHQFSTIIFVYKLLLSEGQTGGTWKSSIKRCYMGSWGALHKYFPFILIWPRKPSQSKTFLWNPY